MQMRGVGVITGDGNYYRVTKMGSFKAGIIHSNEEDEERREQEGA